MYVHACVCVHVNVCICVCMCLCMCMCIGMCMYVCVYACVYVIELFNKVAFEQSRNLQERVSESIHDSEGELLKTERRTKNKVRLLSQEHA